MSGAVPDQPDAAWLRDLLARHGCSQRQAARMLRVPPTTVRRWLAAPGSSSWRPVPWVYARALAAEIDGRAANVLPENSE